MAREDRRTRGAPAARVLLSTTGCAPNGASGSAAGAVGGEQQTPDLETALPDSVDWPDSGSRAAGDSADPHRFRTKRQLWTYSGFGIETHSGADHRNVDVQLRGAKKPITIRGLYRTTQEFEPSSSIDYDSAREDCTLVRFFTNFMDKKQTLTDSVTGPRLLIRSSVSSPTALRELPQPRGQDWALPDPASRNRSQNHRQPARRLKDRCNRRLIRFLPDLKSWDD